MKILLITIGTRGDVLPFIALGAELRKAGHEVALCSSPRYKSLIAAQKLAYHYISDALIALVETPQGRAAISGAGGSLRGIAALPGLLRKSLGIQRELFEDGWAAAQQAAPDLIIYHPKMAIALQYAEKMKRPAIMVNLFPAFLPTGAYPTPGFPELSLGQPGTAAYNRATHHLLRGGVGLASRWLFSSWRKAQTLPPRPWGQDFLLQRNDGSPVPVLNAWSRHLAPDPPEWREKKIQTTGFWVPPAAQEWKPPESLKAFLAAGSPPVYIGFGSMAGKKPAETTRIILSALHENGMRGILARGWGGLSAAAVPESIYMLDEAPHEWLFPQMAAVVHHGGAGTTAAMLRAGRPGVICPFFGDQPFWAARAFEAGLVPKAIPQKRLTAQKLATTLREAVQHPEIGRAAAQMGMRIRAEDGLRNARDFIERYAAEYARSSSK